MNKDISLNFEVFIVTNSSRITSNGQEKTPCEIKFVDAMVLLISEWECILLDNLLNHFNKAAICPDTQQPSWSVENNLFLAYLYTSDQVFLDIVNTQLFFVLS